MDFTSLTCWSAGACGALRTEALDAGSFQGASPKGFRSDLFSGLIGLTSLTVTGLSSCNFAVLTIYIHTYIYMYMNIYVCVYIYIYFFHL